MHNSTAIINYSVTISNLVNVLKQYNYESDLRSSSTLQVAIEKLSPNLKEKLFFFVEERQEDRPDLTLLETWLIRMGLVLSIKECHQPRANKRKMIDQKLTRKNDSKNCQMLVRVRRRNKTKQMQNNNCPLADGTHKIWNSPIFKSMNFTDRYAAVRKERLFYGYLGKGHAIKDCQVNPCGKNGYTKQHNRLLHSESQMHEGSHAVNIIAATINQSNQVTSFHQIFAVSVKSGGNRLTAYAFLDNGSTVLIIDQGSTTSQNHGRYFEHSWHTWDARFEDREGSYHNKGTTFKVAFN